MKNIRISLTGDLGSGKTTVSDILVKYYNLEKVSIGAIQRQMAKEMNLSLTDFSSYMEKHPEFDKVLDDKLRYYDTLDGNFLFDSRMAWYFVPSSFKVYMLATPEVAANRIIKANRCDEQYTNIDEAIRLIALRRHSEKIRYSEMYNVDITDLSNYDLIVKTDDKDALQVADEIIHACDEWLKK